MSNSINGDIVQQTKLKSCTLFFGEKKQHTANNNGKESNSKTTILYKKEHTSVSKINSHYKIITNQNKHHHEVVYTFSYNLTKTMQLKKN
ncbi:hypothetical protein ACE1MK_04900 [Tenacibaculum maritimum]|uniref:hypothetical protein n=1 Tax=Tenacibaculum maritimum TaxID=107401 RepID=UPI0035D11BAE